MPNKQLTATVRLNTSQAERNIDSLVKKINQMNNKLNGVTNNRVETQLTKSQSKLSNIVNKVKAWGNAQKQVGAYTKSTNTVLGTISKKLRHIASAYLGIMGTKAIINTSDTITSAQNKLNYVAAKQLGIEGYNADGTYSKATFQATQDSMDKMYASSQKVRMSYTDMMANVAKSMTLANGAFQNSTDNAIRFQEIMAEAYAAGGASAAEMSTSMYQMIQALGAGTLAGDELRSVREGAPLAYKAIEEFVQGVYNSDESLKDLASQGKVTSDMVVAAIMNMGSEADKVFAQTSQTFGQTWDMIKNAAIKAFEPVSNMLKEALNNAVDNGMIQKIETFFYYVSKVLQILFKIVEKLVIWIVKVFSALFNWLAENWYWIQYIVYAVIVALMMYFTIAALKAIWFGLVAFYSFLTGLAPLYLWIIVIGLVVAALVWLMNSCATTCEFIYNVCMILAQAILAFITAIVIASIIAGTVLMSIPMLIGLFIVALLAILLAAFVKYTGEICGAAYGVYSVIQAICTNISIAWQNMCAGMSQWFWNAIADMLDSCSWLLKGINKIREALGKDPIDIGAIRAKADAAGAKGGQSYVDVGNAWNTGYSKGYSKGTDIQSAINSFGDKIRNFSINDKLNSALGFPSAKDPRYSVADAYNMPSADELLNGVNGIDDNTGKIADSMDLTEEDLEYLRRIADMEWKKEFTTANITVDMSNYNTINGDSDLDGIVTKLADKLYEEMDYMANGVYA